MKFNIAFLGPERLFHLRRDFILSLKYSLEDLGHTVLLSGATLEKSYVNLIIGAYFLRGEQIARIAGSGIPYINVNTEVISGDMLNFNPDKVDFLGAYLPMIKNGIAAWDVIADNLSEYRRYGVKGEFLRWGFHPALRDIKHNTEKDLDFYFFGMVSARRKAILNELQKAGLQGLVDHSCPYFVRNDRIARAKVHLNLIQDDKYTHVNSFRICYLANNNCHILSENENDPVNYLQYTEIITPDNIVEKMRQSLSNNTWKQKADRVAAAFEKTSMNSIMASMLDQAFSNAAQIA